MKSADYKQIYINILKKKKLIILNFLYLMKFLIILKFFMKITIIYKK